MEVIDPTFYPQDTEVQKLLKTILRMQIYITRLEGRIEKLEAMVDSQNADVLTKTP